MSDTPLHEPSDFPVRPISLTAVTMLVALLVILAGIALIYRFQPAAEVADRSIAHGPSATTPIETQRDELAKRFEENLHSLRWIDRDKELVAIPIEQAINRIATDGKLPNWPPSETKPVPRDRPAKERRSP